MSETAITLAFGNGEYAFRLGLAQIAEIQNRTGAGIGAVYARLLKGRYILGNGDSYGNPGEAEFFLADIIETIRQGLIGGGSGVADGLPITVTHGFGIGRRQRLLAVVVGVPLVPDG